MDSYSQWVSEIRTSMGRDSLMGCVCVQIGSEERERPKHHYGPESFAAVCGKCPLGLYYRWGRIEFHMILTLRWSCGFLRKKKIEKKNVCV